MVKQLRRRHFQIWSALLVLIPSGIISATLVIPRQAKSELLQPSLSGALPVVIKTIEKPDYMIRLRGKSQRAAQLEWVNKTALTVPTAVIYKTIPGKQNFRDGDLIGRIESRGTYHFTLMNDSTDHYDFVLYDFIHGQIIDSINFTP